MSTCPTPKKARYATRAGAENAARRVDLGAGMALNPYECACTWWHLTKGETEQLPDPATAATADVQRLTAMPLIDFREVVADDACGKGDPGVRAALRHHANLPRWKKALGSLINDTNLQLRERRGDRSLAAHDWRKRVTGYRNGLQLRLSEARRLTADAQADMVRNGTARRREAQAAALRGASLSELRAQAGEIAVDRLIKAHGDDFARMLAEEYAVLGLELPDRIRRHLPESEAA